MDSIGVMKRQLSLFSLLPTIAIGAETKQE